MLGRIILLLIAIIVFSSQGLSQCPKDPVRLEAFTVNELVSIKTQWRFQVTSIRVGNQSVGHLFRDPNTEQTTWRNGGWFKQVSRPLMVNSGADWEALREALFEEAVLLEADQATLKVSLADRHLSRWKSIPGLGSAIYEQECAIKVLLPSCDRRTRLIYTETVNFAQKKMEGQSPGPIKVDDAFYKLLNGQLEEYIKNLPRPEDGPCVDKIELQKYLETKGTAGFGFGEYQLTEGLKGFLFVMTVAMRNAAKAYSQYHLDVKLVGYTDHAEVGKIDLMASATGVDEAIWRNTPLNVYFDRCIEDRLIKGSEPYYIGFASEPHGSPIETIRNNCQLGAVRAYVAMAYLRSKLGSESVSYSYATGGIKSRGKGDLPDPEDRRINMEFTMKAAREGN